MNDKQLKYISAIYTEKSISKAAEKLYMSQPALSLFLLRFEEEMGVQLFVRQRDGLYPTHACELYINAAQNILRIQRQLDQDLCEINEQHNGCINIGTTVHIGTCVLPKLITRFQEVYPNIEIHIFEGSSQALETKLERGEVDISLMHLPLKNENLKYSEIATERYVLAFSKDHALNQLTYSKGEQYSYIDPAETKNEKFILAFPNQRVRQVSDRILGRAGINPYIYLVSTSVQTALKFASVGLGVTLLPESYIELFKCHHEATFCYLEDNFDAYWIFAIVYNSNTLSVVMKEMIRITKEIFHSK